MNMAKARVTQGLLHPLGIPMDPLQTLRSGMKLRGSTATSGDNREAVALDGNLLQS